MPRSRISFFNKDVLVLFITLSLSAFILLSNSAPPIQKLKFQISWIFAKISYPSKWYKDVLIIQEENQILKNEVIQLSLLNSELESYRKENIRLRELLNFNKDQTINYLTANVVNKSFGITNHTITVNIGEEEGLTKNLPVLDENGLLGKTIKLSEHAALIQLITDKNYRVSIRVGEKKSLGIFVPSHGKYGILEGVRKSMNLSVGEIAYTSGISDIYPANIPVARVIAVNSNTARPFQDVTVEILADLQNFNYVFVVQ